MDAAIRNLITRIHQGPCRFALAVTGGGTGTASWLLSVPGGSRTILEVTVPYSESALSDYLGHTPASFCSVPAAQAMAVRACDRARWLAPGAPVAGVGCTASLRSDRPKRGDHRFHLSLVSATRSTTVSLTLTKEARDREGEELVLDLMLLNLLADAAGVSERLDVPLLPGETVEREDFPPQDPLGRFLRGDWPLLYADLDGRLRAEGPKPAFLLPGSFNPLHEGHAGLLRIARQQVGGAGAFEMTVVNADKPPLAEEEVRRRLAQLSWRAPLWLTRCPTFVEKARLFPGTMFVVGADTATRIVDPRFYQDSPERLAAAMAELGSAGCRFLVAGRRSAAGQFLGLEDLNIPATFADLFRGIPASAFRLDISSTQLRGQPG
jgi:hypothetical protein